MNPQIIIAIISACAVAIPTIITTIVTAKATNTRQSMEIENLSTQIAAMQKKLDKHNGFEGRIIRLETIAEEIANCRENHE